MKANELKFCTGCQQMRLFSEGEKQKRGKGVRWICKQCINRQSPSIYQNKKDQK